MQAKLEALQKQLKAARETFEASDAIEDYREERRIERQIEALLSGETTRRAGHGSGEYTDGRYYR